MSTATILQRSLMLDDQHGRVLECVHPQTLIFIQKLLTTKRFNSIQFIAHLLCLAEEKQQNPFQRTGENDDRAIIPLQSVQELSKRPRWPWGYTTTYKVLRVLEALGILQRQPGELHFLYGAPRLHSNMLLNLQKLQASKTPKVQQLAKKVKKRLEGNQLRPQNQKALEPEATTSNSPLTQAVYTLTHALQKEGILITPQLTARLYEICQEVSRTFTGEPEHLVLQGKSTNGDSSWFSFEGLTVEMEMQQGNFVLEEGNSPSSVEPNSPLNTAVYTPLTREEGCHEFPTLQKEGNSTEAGEQNTYPKFPSSPSNSPHEGLKFPVEQVEGNSLTFNVTNKYNYCNNTNDNVSNSPCSPHTLQQHTHEKTDQLSIARVFSHAIEGHQRNLASYRAYLNRFGYKTLLATFLYVEQQRRSSHTRVKTPGKYFNTMVKVWGGLGTYEQACDVFNQAYNNGATMRMPGIPWDIQRLVAYFEHWALEDVVKEIRVHPDMLLHMPDMDTETNEGGEYAQEEVLLDQAQEVEPRIPSQWMGYEEATALLAQVQHQAAEIVAKTQGASIQVASAPRAYHGRGTQGEAYVIDVTIEGMPISFASESQWRMYYLEQTDLKAYKMFCQQMEGGNGQP